MAAKREYVEISEACRILDIKLSDLEGIENEGLLTLEVIQGKKVVPGDQMDRLGMIMRLKRDLAVNLAGIDVILEMRGRMIQMRREVEQIIDFLHTRISSDIRELLGEENYPMALGPGEEFMAIGRAREVKKADIGE